MASRWTRRDFMVSAVAAAAGYSAGFDARAAAPASPLRSPFPAVALQPRAVKAQFECTAAPAPLTELPAISKYEKDDDSRSIVDPKAEARLRAANQPLTDFTRGLVRMSDDVLADPANAAPRAACAWSWLSTWADGHALEGAGVAETARKWELGTIASTVLKLRGHTPGDPAVETRVLDWLRRLAAEVRDDYSRDQRLPSRRNNHLYWAAWAVTASAIALNDRELWAWGMKGYEFGLKQVQADGHLPLEAGRGARALGYHSFALLPLVMLAEAGEANGQASYQAGGGSLLRLAGFTLDSMSNPATLQRLAGKQQDMEEGLNPRSLAWLEPYYARTRDARALKWLQRMRPLAHRSAGGNLTALFGVPLAG